ncbi:MAG: hypothetical protein RL088_825 [Verrucomicrobiota bacterium]|jgi:hypothetical protein
MHSFSRPSLIALLAVAVAVPVSLIGQDKKPAKKPVPAPAKPGKKEPAAPPAKGTAGLSELPIPKGAPQKEIRFPVYSPDGKKTMYYRIGVATWVDDSNIEMREMELQTYSADGKEESLVKLPDAVLNVPTNVITAKAKITIRDERFEITANSLSYNMDAKDEKNEPDRVATLGGGVKMTIFDTDSMIPKKKSDGPDIQIEPLPKTEEPPKK